MESIIIEASKDGVSSQSRKEREARRRWFSQEATVLLGNGKAQQREETPPLRCGGGGT
jgi:hypothetical protein